VLHGGDHLLIMAENKVDGELVYQSFGLKH
jgi:hypothetical protein